MTAHPHLPSGVVTFVFTDIEGSTRLLHDLGAEAYAIVLADHRRLVRAIAAERGGVEVDTQGDSFFLAFSTAPSAIEAARDIVDRSAAGPARIRIGIHTGQPYLTDEGYIGADVHLAARVAAAGHGDQILVSGATRAQLDDTTGLVGLGEHRLKDIVGPVEIHQSGAGTFPPLRTVANSTVPRPASSFVGRGQEVDEIRDVLLGGARLVTLTGPGGTGKTRLAIEAVARLSGRYAAGTYWVGLRTVHDPALVLPEIALALGGPDDVIEHIGERPMLLLIDNAEQVASAAPALAGLLTACTGLTMLVTSRARLRIPGEVEIAVRPMTLDDAVTLFCERSRLAADDDIATLCRELDALPLAVELAAARTSILTPAQILARLGSRLDLLKGGRELDPRPQTLRSTIDWSYDLLDEDGRALFRRLSIFVGGWTLDAATAVLDADPDVLEALVGHSLVRRTGERFWMLESLRQYAADAFAGDPDAERVSHAFGDWVIEATEEANRHVRGRDQLRWLRSLDDDAANIRAALEAFLADGDADRALRLVRAMTWWMARRGGWAELRRWEAAALALPGGDPGLRGWVQVAREYTSDQAKAVASYREVADLARLAGDERLLGTALEDEGMATPGPAGDALMDAATTIFERLGYVDDLARVAINRVAHDLDGGRDEAALIRSDEALELVRRVGNRHGIGLSMANQAAALVLLGRGAVASPLLREALAQFEEVGEIAGQVLVIEIGSAIAADAGRHREAALLLGAAEALLRRIDVEAEPSDLRLRRYASDALSTVDDALLVAWLDEGRGLELDAAIDVWRVVDATS